MRRRPKLVTETGHALLVLTPTSARGRSGSSAPYDEPDAAARSPRGTMTAALAGVCGGIAQALGVDVTLVRLVFALLALAGGAGIVLYLALWLYADGRTRGWPALGARHRRRRSSCTRSGSPTARSRGIALVAAGLALAWRRGGGLRPDAPLSYGGLRARRHRRRDPARSGGERAARRSSRRARSPAALLLVAGPWLWRLALERDAERAARIRSEERADVAARVHDSVLQTLALIQRHADEPRRVASLARRQERELRGWLYGDRPLGDDGRVARRGALGRGRRRRGACTACAIELASAGDARRRRRARARRPRGDDERGEVRRRRGDRRLRRGDGRRDRGVRPRPRRRLRPRRRARRTGAGIAESIEGRLERAGGRATVDERRPGEGTEVELRLPRSAREAGASYSSTTTGSSSRASGPSSATPSRSWARRERSPTRSR